MSFDSLGILTYESPLRLIREPYVLPPA